MTFWLLALLAAFFVGASKGGLQLVGLLAVPLLALHMPAGQAAGLILPIYILSDWYGLWLYRHEYSARNIAILVPAGLIGVIIGFLTAHLTDENMVKLLVALIGVAYCLDAIFKAWRQIPAKPADVPRGLFWGTIAGFTSFVSHAGGPPYNMFVLPQRLSKMTYAGTTTIIFAIINLLKLPPYWVLDQVNVSSLWICVYLAPMSLFGAWAGYKLTGILPEKIFFRTVELALIVVAILLFKEAVPPLWHQWIG
ncbi:sulfite exporter TauE/SafE family protein [Aestuariivirga litoralis]|uniref:sulfite exporter TauE/SafE family protein n=1 Tax=Aestuariivirga litoralis TaxID=2650924 RepID=UPI001FF0339A|nr:sulfite exporter TauE/SafE family protein [Aestuariivirga litoralis]